MKKVYLVDEDEFSGKMVIICKTVEVEVDTYEPTKDELNAAIYLYRELPQKIEKRTRYEVLVILIFRMVVKIIATMNCLNGLHLIKMKQMKISSRQ